MKMNQKTAVYNAIMSVLANAGIDFSEGMNVKSVMTKEMRGQVNNILFQGFREQTIELDREYDDKDLKAYVSGLQSNWLRKDVRLNGNTKYAPANPGSRTTDPQLQALKNLLKNKSDPDARAEIEGYIVKRTAEIAATKAPQVDFSALPAELADKYSA